MCRKLRYYKHFIPPGGLPQLHLYGVYAATSNDGDKEMYAALLRHCEGGSEGGGEGGGSGGSGTVDIFSSASGSSGGSSDSLDLEWEAAGGATGGAAARTALHPGAARQQAQVAAALAAAEARLEGVTPEERHALLHSGDIHAAVERLLGMRLFLGGVSHSQFHRWAAATGYSINGRPPAAVL